MLEHVADQQEVSLKRSMCVEHLDCVAYGPMLDRQRACHKLVAEGQCADTLYLLEHRPVVTMGRNSSQEHVLVSEAMLRQHGIDLYETGRGGDVTYHGPGQIVGYPIFSLQKNERDIRRFVGLLEEVLIRTAADFGVEAHRIDGLRGIWVGHAKLAAIGVRIARWTTMHGFAINVNCDLSPFELIVPCGLQKMGVTSLEKILGYSPPMTEVRRCLVRHMANLFARQVVDTKLSLQVAEPSVFKPSVPPNDSLVGM